MAALPKVKHVLTIGSEKYALRAADIYGDFGGSTGVTKVSDPDTTNYTAKLTSADFANGKAIRIKCTATNGTGAAKISKSFTVICAFEKAKTALANLDAKKITVDGKTWDITATRIPQRRRFG
ncbi:hypothetical protein [Chamaesiphon sp. OTE_20_metabat_361]|uniref:hypothetical protein n=1 Tax=Chamaesiphon sp. OTE_20_metabat_361 TaxID=2964689 RepID=UPI00286D5520|nr:hypothetical protein [Chamaesiphon sp. OTE_20_metabat_361]